MIFIRSHILTRNSAAQITDNNLSPELIINSKSDQSYNNIILLIRNTTSYHHINWFYTNSKTPIILDNDPRLSPGRIKLAGCEWGGGQVTISLPVAPGSRVNRRSLNSWFVGLHQHANERVISPGIKLSPTHLLAWPHIWSMNGLKWMMLEMKVNKSLCGVKQLARIPDGWLIDLKRNFNIEKVHWEGRSWGSKDCTQGKF